MLGAKFHPISGYDFSQAHLSILFGMSGEKIYMVWY